MVASLTCSSAGKDGRIRSRAAPGAAVGVCPSPVYSQAATCVKCSSSRWASPSGVWYSSRKWPPQDSLRSRASRQISSPSSRKSATRPAFSSDWLKRGAVAQDAHVLPELLAQGGDLLERGLEAFLGAGHAAVLPHDLAQLAMERVHGPLAVDGQQLLDPPVDGRFRLLEGGMVGAHLGQRRRGQVVADRVRDDEVAVGQALHERAGAQPVRAVVREVGFPEHVQAGDRAHEVVVHPQPAHRVVDGGVDAHRDLVRVLVRDALVHVEEVAVLLGDHGLAQPLDGVGEVEVHAEAAGPDARVPRRTPAWPRARRCRGAPGCRSAGYFRSR